VTTNAYPRQLFSRDLRPSIAGLRLARGLLLGFGVQRLILTAIAIIGCQPAQVTYPAAAPDCSPERIGRVTVRGATLADVAPLAVLEGTFDDRERTDRVAEVATELLHVKGYPNARIEIDRAQGCGVELDVAVALGPRYKISDLAFQTDDDFPQDERAAAVEDALGTVNAVGGSYVEDRMVRALTALERRYHESGWIDAKIGRPVTRYDDGRGAVTVIVPIDAGPRYRIGVVRAHGGGRATREAVVAALGLRNGDWYDASQLRTGVDRARKRLDRHVELRVEVGADRTTIDIEARVAGGDR
jgi:outer membrane protein assembly factor BamA